MHGEPPRQAAIPGLFRTFAAETRYGMKKINVITLGCSKNTVDSEHLMARLAAAGYEVLFDSDRTDAKVVVINTCGFIGDAKQESVDMILRAAAAKNAGKIERLFVIGCLSERYADSLRAELPEVDGFFGARTWDGIARALGAAEDPALATERHLSTPRHYAYLKISEGCNWKCGYCAIPLIRGGHVSVPMEELEEEARKLAAGGVKELIVIAQDTTYYGLDLYGKRRLAELLRRLCRIDGIEWIRLHYAYPTAFPDEVIEAMASEPKICKYLDIPFQHISDAQLSAMHRRHTKAEAYALVKKLRGAIPDLALRTTLLVGYPGETEADFTELEQFVRDVRFERLGVFAYSEEEGTYSARELADDVPEEVKQQRVERIMTLQNDIARENNLRRVGRTERVLIDSRQGDYYVGRTQYDSPEVDQEILIPAAERRLLRGHFYEIRIDGAADYDLYGKAVGK
jgi:ribosomal protein S12 methylthiotransferase